PIMEFYEMDELGGQYDNWWGPNTECMVRMLRAAGFVNNTIVLRETARTAIKSSRHFENLPEGSSPSIDVLDVVNAVTFGRQLQRQGRHAFLASFANGLPETISREEIKIVAGGYGTLPCYVGPVGNPDEIKCQFQINAPLPRGLDLGKTEVQIFCRGASSNSAMIEVVEGSPW